jgi:hypothetical protein
MSNVNYQNIHNAPPVHQQNRRENKFSYNFNTNPPASSSIVVDALPWLAGVTHNFYYTGLETPITFQAGTAPTMLTTTGTITAAGNGNLVVGFSTVSEGIPDVLPFLTQNIPLVAGSNVIQAFSPSPLVSNLSEAWVTFTPDVNITAVAEPLSIVVIYAY